MNHPSHRTASAVLTRNGRILLEERSRDASVYAGCWDTPGGHVEPTEDPEDALVREMREELGVHIERCFLGCVQDDHAPERTAGRTYRHYVYRVERFRGNPEPRLHQHLEWRSIDQLVAGDLPNVNPLTVDAVRHFVAAGWI